MINDNTERPIYSIEDDDDDAPLYALDTDDDKPPTRFRMPKMPRWMKMMKKKRPLSVKITLLL